MHSTWSNQDCTVRPQKVQELTGEKRSLMQYLLVLHRVTKTEAVKLRIQLGRGELPIPLSFLFFPQVLVLLKKVK